MHQYIEIDGEQIYIHGIVSVIYNENIEIDGDVVDREPVPIPVDNSSLVVTLANGDKIIRSGGHATCIYGLISSVSELVPPPQD